MEPTMEPVGSAVVGTAVVTALRAEPRYLGYFAATAASVLAQDGLAEWQLVLDTDDRDARPVDLLDELGLTELVDDPRVRVSVSTGGASAARHRGILQAGCDRFVNLDGDDVLLPGALRRIDASLVGGARFGLANTVEARGDADSGELHRPVDHEFFADLWPAGWLRWCWLEQLPPYTNPARLTTLHAHRGAYLDAGGYSPMPRCEEMLLLRNLDRGGRLRILGEATHLYRRHEASVTSAPADGLGDLQWDLLWD